MRPVFTLTALLALVSITGCQSGWVRLDGNRTDSVALEQERSDNSVEASKALSNEARMLQLDNFEDNSFAIYQAINDCMQSEGYRKP